MKKAQRRGPLIVRGFKLFTIGSGGEVMLKQEQVRLTEKGTDVEGTVKSEYPNPVSKGLRRKCEYVRTCLPNTRKRTVSTVKPNN